MPADVERMRAVVRPRGASRWWRTRRAPPARTYHGRPVGAGAELAAWSFHPRKLLTTGEGGMLTTARRRAGRAGPPAARARHERQRRRAPREPCSRSSRSYLEVGFNYRMTDIQAAVGLVQLGKLDAMVARRRELAGRYQALLADVPGLRAVRDPAWGDVELPVLLGRARRRVPAEPQRARSPPWPRPASRRARGIMAAHRQPAYAGHPHADLPVTERLTDSTLILPVFHHMGEQEQDTVVGARPRGRRSPGGVMPAPPLVTRAARPGRRSRP